MNIKHVKTTGSTTETKRIQDDVRLRVSKMMFSNIEEFDQIVEQFQDSFKDYQIFYLDLTIYDCLKRSYDVKLGVYLPVSTLIL